MRAILAWYSFKFRREDKGVCIVSIRFLGIWSVNVRFIGRVRASTLFGVVRLSMVSRILKLYNSTHLISKSIPESAVDLVSKMPSGTEVAGL